jgi:hypothetical protein
LLTTNTTKNITGTNGNKQDDPKDRLKGLAGLTPEFFEDFIWGLEFGAFQHDKHIIWKYGNPWLYPADEFQMLKTAVRGMNVVSILRVQEDRTAKADIGKALGISDDQKEKNKTTAKSMASFFKDLPK